MFASKAESRSFAKREKPYSRKTRPMTRSGSLLDTIKDIVSAPLSWFASNQEDFEDLGKRRRVVTRDFEDIEEQQDERRGKRMRVDSPELPVHAQPPDMGGYLDPPPLSSFASRLIARRSPEKRLKSDKRASSVGPFIPPNRHAMSLEPQSRYATFGRGSARVSLSSKSPIGLNPYGSTAAGTDPERSRMPSGLQTTFPPQSDPGSPRRELSAPPFPSLQSRPTFVKPPTGEKHNQAPNVQKKVTLGTLADLSRASRAPSRDRMLNILGQTSGDSDQIVPLASSDAISKPPRSLSAKIYHELERYKTPILPSRYKDASEVPPFLKPKRSHVPIPMSKKGRGSRPSLGMSGGHEKQKTEVGSRDGGKPYARTGGTATLIARRKAEEEEERQRNVADSTLTSVDEDDEMETDGPPPVSKRDVGVSAQLPSSSEEERTRIPPVETIETPPVPSATAGDPFSHPPVTTPGGRPQPYGRVSRTRTREPGHRSVALPRGRNKFSAKPADDEITIMEDQSMLDVTSTEQSQPGAETTRTPAYEAPKGFSFPNDTASINHDISRAKEPPIPSLPFSLGRRSEDVGTSASKPKEAMSFKLPTTTLPEFQVPSEQGKEKRDESPLSAPSVSVKQATSGQSANEVKETSAPASSNICTAAPSSSGVESSPVSGRAPKPAGIPNFFANSPLLASNKATAPSSKTPSPTPFPTSVPGTSPATPVKDPENPLWDGNVSSGAPPKLFAATTKPVTFGAKSVEAEGTTTALAVPTPLSGGQTDQTTAGPTGQQQSDTAAPIPSEKAPPSVTTPAAEPAQVQPALPKPTEPERKSIGASPSTLFNFGGGTPSNVPKPLFGTGSVASSAFPTQPSQSGQSVSKEPTPKQIFAFGQPQTPETGSKPPVTQSSQPSQSGAAPTEQKSTFTFGAPPMPTGTGNASASTINNAVAAPKPVVGGPGGGTTFTFGTPASPAQNTEAAKPSSPFAFGAPPATPPAGGERQNSPFAFGAPGPSSGASAGFTFGTPIKENGSTAGSAPSTPTNTSPFVFGAPSQPVRPVTPPSKPDEGMSMEESPVQMDTNGGQKRPAASISFGAGPTPVNPFGQSSGPTFTFGAPVSSNPFAQKDENKPSDTGGFNFNRTASAPTISTSFSFGAKSDQSTPPATAFGAPPNPFTSSQTSGQTTSPFAFGQQQAASLANPFGASTQPAQTTGASGSTPSDPFSGAGTFNFGAPSGGSSNPFAFGSNTPSSPASGASGLPQTSSTSGSTPPFTFGQPSASGSSTGGTFFNIGAPPPATNPSTPARQIKKLPRRAAKR